MSRPSAWSEMERVALLGTRRAALDRLQIAPALDALLAALDEEDAEHLLLSAAGTLDLYEQIGRLPARLRPDAAASLPEESLPACPPQAADYLARLLEGSRRNLMPELLEALHEAGMRIPDTLLPNMLALGRKQAQARPLILKVLGRRGRWLAAHHPDWHYAAVDPGSWPGIRAAWEQASRAQRPPLVAQLREANAAQGRALVESVWRAENDQMRLLLIKQLEIGLSMEDEPLLEAALDDRSRLVRRRAAELLAHLTESRLSLRMMGYVPSYLAWTPAQTRRITVSLPPVTAAMRRDGIVGANSKVAARVRSQEIIQLVGAVPLDSWCEAWQAEPRTILQAVATTSWPRTLTSGFSLAAVRQRNGRWARAILEELGVTAVTMRLIPVLEPNVFRALTLRALAETKPGEFGRNSALVAVLRRWEDPWEAALAARLVERFVSYFRATADARRPDNMIRELFLKLARKSHPDLLETAADLLGDTQELGQWHAPAVEFLHILRFRREMHEALWQQEGKGKNGQPAVE